MSQISKVEVLCPNGHRMQVKVNSGTRLLQILEECCLKQRLGEANGFELKHKGKSLDLSLSAPLAGLTNNAKLDLVQSVNARLATTATVVLQLEDGTRLQRDFDSSATFWEVIESFQEDDSRNGKLNLPDYKSENTHPVVNYLKDEILGEYALKSTTLRTIGIMGRGHLLRFLFKSASDEKLQEIKDKIDKEKARLSKLASKAAETNSSYTAFKIMSSSLTSPSDAISESSETADLLTENLSEDVPMEITHQDIGAANENQSALISARGLFQFDQNINQSAMESFDNSESLQFLLWQQQQQKQNSNFAQFKFPEETKGKDVYHNELSDVNKGDFEPCDRKAVLFRLDDSPQVSVEYEPVGDEFFEHTVSDVKLWYSDRQRQVESFDSQPLTTQSMKKAQLESRLSRYSRVVIRIQFPDRFVLQILFRPIETVFAVYKCVKENLKDKNMTFELYTAPPKTVLKDKTLTLIEAGLVPQSIVYFGSGEKIEDFLADDVLKNVSTQLEAKKVVNEFLHASPTVSESSSNSGITMETSSHSDVARPFRPSPSVATGSSLSQSSNKTPAWFKPGRK